MNKKQTVIITGLTIIVIILAILASSRFWVRLDFTKNKAYTISKVSRNLYKEITEPVIISYYISDSLKKRYPVPGEIEDTLRAYAAHSKGKIRLVVRDPVKADLTAMVEQLGIQAMQDRIVEQDQATLITVYSGIVIEYVDKIDVLPWVFDIGTLEYDLTSRIRAMITNTEREIGIIVADSFRKMDQDFGYLGMFLQRSGYRVRTFFPGDEIPDNLSGLFVLGGAEDLDDIALYRIDRYIQMGGKVLFAVKGVYIDTIYGSIQARLLDSTATPGLLEMIATYGVIIKPELVLDRTALVLQYQTRTQQGSVQYRITRYPLWIGVPADNGNPKHPVSSNFSGLDLFWASPLYLNTVSSVQAEELFTSTNQGWLQMEPFNTSPEIPYMLEINAEETRGAHILGVSLTGEFPSLFKNLPKPLEDLPDMPSHARPSRIIVVGDVDFATNIIESTQSWHNLEFLMRAADWLTNDDDIINIRSRQPQAGRLDKIADPANKRAAMRLTQILNVGIIPALVIAAALILAYKRKRRMDNEI